MTIETQIHTLYDGEMNAVVQIIGKSDGQAGQEANVVKVDVSELLPSTCRAESSRCCGTI